MFLDSTAVCIRKNAGAISRASTAFLCVQPTPGDVRELSTTLGRCCGCANASAYSVDLDETAANAPLLRRWARFSTLPAVPTTAALAAAAICMAAKPRPPACASPNKSQWLQGVINYTNPMLVFQPVIMLHST